MLQTGRVPAERETQGDGDDAAEPDQDPASGKVQAGLPFGRPVSQSQAQAALGAMETEPAQQKVRQDPEPHHQSFHPLQTAEKYQVSHQGEKGGGEPGAEGGTETALDRGAHGAEQQGKEPQPRRAGEEVLPRFLLPRQKEKADRQGKGQQIQGGKGAAEQRLPPERQQLTGVYGPGGLQQDQHQHQKQDRPHRPGQPRQAAKGTQGGDQDQ